MIIRLEYHARRRTFFVLVLTAAVVAATIIVIIIVTAKAITTAEKNENDNNNPGTTAKTRITAHKNASFQFTLYIMAKIKKCYRYLINALLTFNFLQV